MAAFTTEQVRLVDIDMTVPPVRAVHVGHVARMVASLAAAGWTVGRISVKHKPVVVAGGTLYDLIDGFHRLTALFANTVVTPDVMVSCDIYEATVDRVVEGLRLNAPFTVPPLRSRPRSPIRDGSLSRSRSRSPHRLEALKPKEKEQEELAERGQAGGALGYMERPSEDKLECLGILLGMLESKEGVSTARGRVCLGFIMKMLKQVWATATPDSTWAVSLLCGATEELDEAEQLEVLPLPTLVERQPLINLADCVLSYSRWL
jgi:hypothetical protein